MWVDMWPIRVKMWQLFLIAVWVWLTLAIMKPLLESWMGKIPAFIIASPVLIFFLVLAFFKKSELTFIPFVAKLISTYIIDSPKRFQRNITKPDRTEIIVKYAKKTSQDQTAIIQKDFDLDEKDKEIDILDKW